MSVDVGQVAIQLGGLIVAGAISAVITSMTLRRQRSDAVASEQRARAGTASERAVEALMQLLRLPRAPSGAISSAPLEGRMAGAGAEAKWLRRHDELLVAIYVTSLDLPAAPRSLLQWALGQLTAAETIELEPDIGPLAEQVLRTAVVWCALDYISAFRRGDQSPRQWSFQWEVSPPNMAHAPDDALPALRLCPASEVL